MAYPKQIQLVKTLYARTMNSTLDWKWREQDESCFLVVGARTIEIVIVYNDELEANDVEVRLYDKGGALIESFRDTDFSPSDLEVEDQKTSYGYMIELYNMARRSALNLDVAIDEILADL